MLAWTAATAGAPPLARPRGRSCTSAITYPPYLILPYPALRQELYLEDVLQATRWAPDRGCDCLRGGGGGGGGGGKGEERCAAACIL